MFCYPDVRNGGGGGVLDSWLVKLNKVNKIKVVSRVRSDIFRSAKKEKKPEISARKLSFHTEKFPLFPISILCLID